MKIKTMTAVFGGLNGAALELGPGLNLIEAPNEGGKSTWCAFLRAMLYGIDTRDRDKKGHLADKNRFQPWSGAPMAGELTLEWQGREITIRRGRRGNTPFGAFSAVYAGTQEPVPGLSASVCGELLTGVGQEMYARSAFLGAGSMAVTSSPELERRIAALVTSGEEDVSFTQAMGRLKEWKNRRQVNRSAGEIPRLEEELDRIREKLFRLEDLSAQIARLEGERAVLERRREAARELAQEQLSQRLELAREEYRQAREHLEALESGPVLPGQEELRGAQGELEYLRVLDSELRQGVPALEEAEETARQAQEAAQDALFSGLTGEAAAARAEADRAGCQTAQADAAALKKRCLLLHLLGLLGLVPLLLWGIVKRAPLWIGLGAGLYLLMAAASILALIRSRAAKHRGEEILSHYGVWTPEEITALAQDYRARCQAAAEAAHKAEVIRAAVAERRAKREETKTALLAFVHRFAPEVRDMYGCSAALSRALNLEHNLALARERAQQRRRRLEELSAQEGVGAESAALAQEGLRLEQVNARLNQAQGMLQALGDPAALTARREELESALDRRRQELEAITLAMEVLTQANARLQERFSPALNAQAGQYLARLTGDRYQAVSLTRELEGFVRSQGEVLPRSALYLSRGTADQLYLAVRLAVCRLCLAEKPPIVLDDALSAFDDRRLAGALALLCELAEEQQILLFTCHRRESAALAEVPGVTRITLP